MADDYSVVSDLLRQDALRWDDIAAAFQQGMDVLEDRANSYGWFLDSITATKTEFQSEFVSLSCEIKNFAYRGRDVISGSSQLGMFGVAMTLRAMADAYDATDDDAAVTFAEINRRLQGQ